ncbi:MAG: hypothetical protein ABIM50_07130 [Novosphingobium sp.]
MDYISVADARILPGLRLALSEGAPAPWSIAARALFDIRNVTYAAVRQELGRPNEDLVAWTGRRNAPVAIFEDEPAVDGWLEIAVLAERLGAGPSLFPEDPVERALAVGFSAEICGHGGFGWSWRVALAGAAKSSTQTDAEQAQSPIARQYGIRADAVAMAPGRIAGVLRGLAAQLHRQDNAGSEYLVGQQLSVCDVHWACFSLLLKRLAPEQSIALPPKGDPLSTMPAEVCEAFDPILVDHRDRILERHIGLPLDY